jgi:hypothetical protein
MPIGEICAQDGAILDARDRRGLLSSEGWRRLHWDRARRDPPSPSTRFGMVMGPVPVVRGPFGRGLVQLLWSNAKGRRPSRNGFGPGSWAIALDGISRSEMSGTPGPRSTAHIFDAGSRLCAPRALAGVLVPPYDSSGSSIAPVSRSRTSSQHAARFEGISRPEGHEQVQWFSYDSDRVIQIEESAHRHV